MKSVGSFETLGRCAGSLTPMDPVTIGIAVGTLGAVTLLASRIPAARASRVNPVAALIDESLARFDVVWAAAGTGNTAFPILFSSLIEITGGRVVELS